MGFEDVFGLVDATGTRSKWSAKAAPRKVSSTTLHKDTRPTLDLLREVSAVAVTHYNEVEGYLVAPAALEGLVTEAAEATERARELETTLPMLLAAARAGVAIPSDILERLLPGQGSDHWRDIAEFAASYPVTLTHDEGGEPIARAHISAGYGYIGESGDDEELNLD